jgi:hypothetical protein
LGSQAYEKLKDNYTILQLETFQVNGQDVPSYCVLDNECIPITELPELENLKKIHSDFVIEYYKGNYDYCRSTGEFLIGRWGGKVDSFYQEILNRIRL